MIQKIIMAFVLILPWHVSYSSHLFDGINFEGIRPHYTPLKINNTATQSHSSPQKTAFIQIGIDYMGTSNQLKGCGDDIENFFHQRIYPRMQSGSLNSQNTEFYVLTDVQPYALKIEKTLKEFEQKRINKKEEDIVDIFSSQFINYDVQTKIPNKTQLVYGAPTRAHIESVLTHVMSKDDINSIVLHYSGHGSQTWAQRDTEEPDSMDEVIVPVDFDQKGMITDDWLTQTVVEAMPYKKALQGVFALMDCCHSGTIFDLPYKAVLGNNTTLTCQHIRKKEYPVTPNILVLSGCRDNQTSADAFLEGEYQGALTYGFLKTCQKMEKKYIYPLKDIFSQLDESMKKFPQNPQITSGFCFNSQCASSTQDTHTFIQARINQILAPILD